MEPVTPIRTDSPAIRRTKSIAKMVVGSSVAFTTSRLLSANTPTDKRRHKAEVVVGSMAMGMMASEAAESWTDRKIDAAVDGWRKFKSDIKDATSTK
jgi:hypothetical protein